MRTAKEYRRIAWNAIRPHWRVMLLIALTAVLPQLIEFFLQLLFGLIPPIDMQFWFSDPSRFLAAYDAFVVQTLAPNLLLNVLFNCLSVPLTLGLIFLLHKPLGVSIVSVFTAYLCCEILNWVREIVSALTHSVLAGEISYAVLIVPVFLLLRLALPLNG